MTGKFPDEFVKRIKTQTSINTEALLDALNDPSPVSIRTNPLKWDLQPSDSEPVPWCENGFYIRTRPSFTLDPLFQTGCYYPQEASGMFLEQVIKQTADSLENIRLLDLCGAPGGKSTHLSSLTGTGSLLISNEVIRSRALVLSETITKWGIGNTVVTNNDPSRFARLPGYFDIILVDAPCSGEGMFRNDIAVNEWSVENTYHCSERQKRILMDIWPALKENGILIYSTCTFNPGENEENIKWLIEKQQAESIKLNIDFNGIEEIDFMGIHGYGFYPDKVKGEGFFISAIRKTGKQERTQLESLKKTELRPGKNDYETAGRWTSFSEANLLKWNDELFSVPCTVDEYTNLYQNLKIMKGGTKLFTVKNNDYLPSPELALSTGILSDAFYASELSLHEAIGYLRRDNIILKNSPKGWGLVTYKGVNLGFVKNMGNRVNNYFPVEWRIRMNAPERGEENIIIWLRAEERGEE